MRICRATTIARVPHNQGNLIIMIQNLFLIAELYILFPLIPIYFFPPYSYKIGPIFISCDSGSLMPYHPRITNATRSVGNNHGGQRELSQLGAPTNTKHLHIRVCVTIHIHSFKIPIQ